MKKNHIYMYSMIQKMWVVTFMYKTAVRKVGT